MVYKRYIIRNGKRYGPYYYKCYREGGKVISEFVSGPQKRDRVLRKIDDKRHLITFLSLFFVIVVFMFVIFQGGFINITGFSIFGEIKISKALHLDEDRDFISDIYGWVNEKDDNWSEVINDGEYIRIRFEQNLTKDNDITIYARSVDDSLAEIEVYREDGSSIVARIENILDEGWYKTYLGGLEDGESLDVFDLKISNGAIEFDYIVDPISTSIYYPNSTGCSAWNGSDDEFPPSTLELEKESSLSEEGLINISVDDSNYIQSTSGGWPPIDTTSGHRILFRINENRNDINNITINVEGYGDSSMINNFTFFIWNYTSSSWIYLKSHSSASKANLNHTLSSSITDYINSSGNLNILTISKLGATVNTWLYYAELKVNYTSDSTPPDLNITYPDNNTDTTNTELDINYTTADETALDSCWYSNDSMSINTTLTNCSTNITTVTWSVGTHNVTVWANDSSGNENSSVVSFTISTPTTTGGGSWSGPRIIPIIPPIEKDFSVDKNKIEVTLNPGESKEEDIKITNTENESQSFILSLSSDLKSFVNLSAGSLNLSSLEEKIISLLFSSKEDEKPGVYDGSLKIKGSDKEKEVSIKYTLKNESKEEKEEEEEPIEEKWPKINITPPDFGYLILEFKFDKGKINLISKKHEKGFFPLARPNLRREYKVNAYSEDKEFLYSTSFGNPGRIFSDAFEENTRGITGRISGGFQGGMSGGIMELKNVRFYIIIPGEKELGKIEILRKEERIFEKCFVDDCMEEILYSPTCGDGTCDESEIETCPEDCVFETLECMKEGETVPVIPDAPECCEGLAKISVATYIEATSMSAERCIYAQGSMICSDCGNGICEEWENQCNCEEDCEEGCSEDSDCNDNIDCTVDSCNTQTGECSNIPDDNLCPANQVCDPVLDCQDRDDDGDGFSPPEDCNDTDANINPDEIEICDDGLDNDCDGSENNGCGCETGDSVQCGESDVGECEYGTLECIERVWGICQGAVLPDIEICDDGLDNDCDGSADEDCEILEIEEWFEEEPEIFEEGFEEEPEIFEEGFEEEPEEGVLKEEKPKKVFEEAGKILEKIGIPQMISLFVGGILIGVAIVILLLVLYRLKKKRFKKSLKIFKTFKKRRNVIIT